MSSMLFRPIMREPFQSTEEYREETFTMGSPRVFQTAPPHPASKARITWSPQFAGGPEASQNGLGHRMPPAKVVLSSAIVRLLTVLRYFTLAGRRAANHGCGHGCCGPSGRPGLTRVFVIFVVSHNIFGYTRPHNPFGRRHDL